MCPLWPTPIFSAMMQETTAHAELAFYSRMIQALLRIWVKYQTSGEPASNEISPRIFPPL